MLIISRKVGEGIVIDEQITVTIIEVRGDRVKLAIAAPPTVLIDRAEVRQRVAAGAEDQVPASQATREQKTAL